MRLIFLFSFALLAGALSAQTWSVGTQWYYRQNYFFPPLPGQTQDTLRVLSITGDTIIDGAPVIILEGECACSSIGSPAYLRIDGDRVYWYGNGSFHLLYDFSLSPGDTLTVPYGGFSGNALDTTKWIVDSVGWYVAPNGDSLPMQFVLPHSGAFGVGDEYYSDWGPAFIEGIGSTGWCLFPQYPLCENGTDPVLCVQAPAGPLYPPGAAGSACNVILSAEQPAMADIRLFPSPVTDRLQIESPLVVDRYRVLAPDGRMLSVGQPAAPAFEIEAGSLPVGVYLLELEAGGQRVWRKFLKGD